MSLAINQMEAKMLKIPDPPAHTGKCATVYFEPMIGSGERITVLLALICEDSQLLVEYAIRPDRMEAIFGRQAAAVQDMIRWTGESIADSIERGHTLPFCKFPLDGFTMGDVYKICYDTPLDAFRQMKQMRSGFSCLGCRMPVGGPLIACAEHGGEP